MSSQSAREHSIEHQHEDYVMNIAQLEFMINIDSAAEHADEVDDFAFFDEVVASEAWQQLFGKMSWDQAYDL